LEEFLASLDLLASRDMILQEPERDERARMFTELERIVRKIRTGDRSFSGTLSRAISNATDPRIANILTPFQD